MRKGLIVGIVLLLVVDVVWVGSAGISRVSRQSNLWPVTRARGCSTMDTVPCGTVSRGVVSTIILCIIILPRVICIKSMPTHVSMYLYLHEKARPMYIRKAASGTQEKLVILGGM